LDQKSCYRFSGRQGGEVNMSEDSKLSWFYVTEYQKAFIQKFLDKDSPPNHILLAPVGTGKSATSFAIIKEMIESGARKILILIPSSVLITQYKDLLSELNKDINIAVLNRKLVREIDTFDRNEPFAEKILGIATLQQAAHDEVKENILSVQWDLIILDEVDHISANSKQAALLSTIIKTQIAKRILILSNLTRAIVSHTHRGFLNNRFIEDFEVTQWRQKDIFPSKDMRPIRYTTISFKRTEEEIDFIKKYISLSRWLSNKKFQNKIRSRLVSSSLYAAEESLRTLRNRLVHGELSNVLETNETGKEFINNEELLGDINSAEIDKRFSSKDLPKLMAELSITLDLLDNIQVDSKFNILSQVLPQVLRDRDTIRQKTWIYASFQSTIAYLHSSLREFAHNIYQIHGQMPSHNVTDYIQQFRNEGGILIASTNRLASINLRIDNLILYDIPESESLTYNIFTQLSRPLAVRADGSVNVFILADTTDILTSEQVRLRKLQRLIQQLIHEGM
jgi:hypothetical protein